jgi:hypothetical protein
VTTGAGRTHPLGFNLGHYGTRCVESRLKVVARIEAIRPIRATMVARTLYYCA